MSLKITIPKIEKPKTLKDAIILILSKEWPLTAKKLYNTVRKGYGFSVTYQAVHKVLRQMIEEGVISKERKEYSICRDWVEKNKEFYQKLGRKVSSGNYISPEEAVKNGANIEFDNFFDFYSFILEVYDIAVNDSPSGRFGVEWNHMYWALAGSKKEQDNFRNVLRKSKGSCILCGGNALSDQMMSEYYKGYGIKVKTGVKRNENHDTIVVRDLITNVFFEEKMKKEIEKIYGKMGQESPERIMSFYEKLFNQKTKIKIAITKNSDLANYIINGIEKRFGELDSHENKKLVFNTLYDVDKFLLTLMEQMASGNKGDVYCLEWDHYWTPLFLNRDVYRKIKNASKKGTFYMAVHSKSAIDKWCLNFLERGSKSVKVKTGVNSKGTFLVGGDYVVQIFYPKKIMDEIGRIYSDAKKVENLDVERLFKNIFERKSEIPISITNNPVLAKQIKKRIMGYFK